MKNGLNKILLTGTAAEDDSVRVHLLADIRDIFNPKPIDKNAVLPPPLDRISSRELVAVLLADETSSWLEFNKGKPLTEVTVARLLKPFEIAPRTIKLVEGQPVTARGYLREFFEDAWSRYLPPADTPQPLLAGSEPSPASLLNDDTGQMTFLEASPEPSVTLLKKSFRPMNTRTVTPVTDQKPQGARNNGQGRCYVHGESAAFWTTSQGQKLCKQCHPPGQQTPIGDEILFS